MAPRVQPLDALRRFFKSLSPSRMKRTRRRRPHFEFHTVSDDDNLTDEDSIRAPRSTPVEDTHRHVNITSHNGHISSRTSFFTTPAFATKRPRVDSPANPDLPVTDAEDDTEDDIFEMMTGEGLDEAYIHQILEDDTRTPRRRTAGDNPLQQWMPHVGEWLDELLRLEGRCEYALEVCTQCQARDELYRCDDCQDLRLYCGTCTRETHARNPLHRLTQWMKTHFRRTKLKELGLRIQLGHAPGEVCHRPVHAPGDDFIIIDVDGMHEVGLDFCGCGTAQSHTTQLLRARLLPATSVSPKTAATFRVLQLFHLLSNQSKVSAFEFYNTLSRRTENIGVDPPKDRYPSFLRMSRMWRHLKMLKRSGRGHDPGGVGATPRGACAVLCPACPHPGKNLPDNWTEASPDKRWLYRLFVGIDANFRLKRKKVSSDRVDPGLGRGYGYFVEEKDYKDFLARFSDLIVEEPSDCNNHDAVKLAHMKGSQGTAASGVGTIECSRHDMKRPCSVGDLQKGERYINMDYLFFSSLGHHSTDDVVVSYDIACQWSRNIWNRLLQYESTFDWEHQNMTFLIPKFHLPAHVASCQTGYSFNLTPNVGRTDGEAVERGWAAVNPFASSTKEMGPGSRRDLLDDVFGDYNWRKVSQLAKSLLSKIKNAVEERNTQITEFEALTSALPIENTTEWNEAVQAWEMDPKKTNPFVVTRPNITLAAARLRIAHEEAAAIQQGRSTTLHEKVSGGEMIMAGLELEEQQRRLSTDHSMLGQHSTDLQRAKIQERRNVLQRQIEAWADIQVLYMPGVASLRSRLSATSQQSDCILAENLPLLLPSAACSRMPCDAPMLEHEWELRYAQCHEALDDLRQHLRLRTHMFKYKDRFVRGQREGTRARTVIANVEAKVNADAARYRVAFEALLTMSRPLMKTGWQAVLRPLHAADVKGFEDDPTVSQGRVTLSWIWKAPRILRSEDVDVEEDESARDNEDMQDALRIEWCKARARARRWTEECDLIQEEMRRVEAFHEWQARWWLEQAERRMELCPDYAEGLRAYAARQAGIRHLMASFCAKAWAHVRTFVCIADQILGDGDGTPDSALTVSSIAEK